MIKAQVLLQLKAEIHELMGALSIEEVTGNNALILQFEIVLSELSKAV